VLFEQSDFAKGTSSRSTKLVHGGVRYLAQGDISLVLEALHERGLLRTPKIRKYKKGSKSCYPKYQIALMSKPYQIL
jgi:glycerol-3-phosphate dehydrogenase